jgi:small-conductance mechanosensitive channel
MNAIAREAVRQQKETFDQLKRQDRQWFALRLVMGYCAVVLLVVVLALCTVILFRLHDYPTFVVKAASVTLFADVVGLLIAVWKFALSPNFQNRLRPVTDISAAGGTPRV